MCPVCAIKAVIKSVISKHRRARIYRNMQRSTAPARHVPAVRDGIETYNYRGE